MMRVLNIRSIFLRPSGQRADNGPVVAQEAEEWPGLCESPALVPGCELQREVFPIECVPGLPLSRDVILGSCPSAKELISTLEAHIKGSSCRHP